MRICVACLVALAVSVSAQSPEVPADLAPFIPLEAHPDLFHEVTVEQEGWGTTTGWMHTHWLGSWEVEGGALQTHVLRITTSHDPDLRLPPVMEDLTLRVDDQGLAAVRSRVITAELPDEVIEFPEGSWLLPLPIETGRVWTTTAESQRTWSQIIATDAASPNPLVTDAPCVQTMTVGLERRSSGALVLSVSAIWWAPGLGPVLIEEARGLPGGLIWEQTPAESLGVLAERRTELPERATLRLMPPAE